jgi:riboflavin synthase alpha subunit
MAMPPKLTGTAMLSFEEGINNLDEFKRVFMGGFSNSDGVSINVNGASGSQFNVAVQGSKIKATQNNNPILPEINNLLDDLLSKIHEELSNEIKEQIKNSVSAIKKELQNPVPNKDAIKTMLFGMKTHF